MNIRQGFGPGTVVTSHESKLFGPGVGRLGYEVAGHEHKTTVGLLMLGDRETHRLRDGCSSGLPPAFFNRQAFVCGSLHKVNEFTISVTPQHLTDSTTASLAV